MADKGDKDLRSRLKKGLGAQGYAQAVQILVRLIEVPLLIGFWGTHLYGEWLMLAAIPSYLAIFDGGFAGAAAREMSMRSGAGDRAGALSLFQSTWILLLLVSLLVGTISFFAIAVAPIHDWLGFTVMAPEAAMLVTLLLVVHILIGFQADLLYGGFWCESRYSLGMALLATTQLLEFAGLSIAVVIGGGPVEAAIGYVSGRMLGLILLRLGLSRATPWLRCGWRQARFGSVRAIASPAIASLAFPLGNALNFQGVRLVVGVVLGPSAVVVLSTLRTLSRLSIQPSGVINRLIEPEMAVAHGGNLHDVFNRIFNRSCQVALWVSAAACLALCVTGEWILDWWTHGKVAMDWFLYILLIVAAAINSVWYTALMAAYSTNRHVRVAIAYVVVYGATALVFAYVLVNMAGLKGIGWSVLVVEVVMAPYVVKQTLNLVGESWSTWFEEISRPPFFLIRRTVSGSASHG